MKEVQIEIIAREFINLSANPFIYLEGEDKEIILLRMDETYYVSFFNKGYNFRNEVAFSTILNKATKFNNKYEAYDYFNLVKKLYTGIDEKTLMHEADKMDTLSHPRFKHFSSRKI